MIVQPPLYRNTFSLHQGCNGGQLHGTLFILAGHHQTGQPGRQGKSGHPFPVSVRLPSSSVAPRAANKFTARCITRGQEHPANGNFPVR